MVKTWKVFAHNNFFPERILEDFGYIIVPKKYVLKVSKYFIYHFFLDPTFQQNLLHQSINSRDNGHTFYSLDNHPDDSKADRVIFSPHFKHTSVGAESYMKYVSHISNLQLELNSI